MPKFFTYYNPGPSPTSGPFEPTLTKQSEFPQTTIQYQVDRFLRTGIWGDPLETAKINYADLTRVHSFAEVQQKLALAKTLFEQLSPADKKQFEDEVDFIAYLTDEGKRDDEVWQEAHKRLELGEDFVLSDREYIAAEGGETIAEGENLLKPQEAASAEGGNDSTADGTDV